VKETLAFVRYDCIKYSLVMINLSTD